MGTMSETPDTPDASPHRRAAATPVGAGARGARPATPRRAPSAAGSRERTRPVAGSPTGAGAEDRATRQEREDQRRERAERRAREAAQRHAQQDREAAGQTPQRPVVRLALPNGWARALLSGVEAAFIGWGLAMLLTLVGYLAVSSNAWLTKATWNDAMAVGGDLWAAALGAGVVVGDVAYWAVPTGLTLLVVLALRALLIPGGRFQASSQWMAVPGFALSALVLAGATAGHVTVWHALPGAILVPFLAAAWAVVSQTSVWPDWCARVGWVWDGLRQARAALVAALVSGALALVASLYVHWGDVRALHTLLLPASTTDSVVIVAAQVLFAPTAVVWALAWLAGPGFWVGVDTLHAPGWAPTAPIPAIPLLGALPATAPGNWVAWFLVGAGVLVGAFVRWRHRAERVREQLLRGLVAVLATALVAAALLALGTLHLGGGRMALLGPRVGWGAILVALEVTGVAVLVATATHPSTWSWLRALRAAWSGELPSGQTDARGNTIVAASAASRAGHAWSAAGAALAGKAREVTAHRGAGTTDDEGGTGTPEAHDADHGPATSGVRTPGKGTTHRGGHALVEGEEPDTARGTDAVADRGEEPVDEAPTEVIAAQAGDGADSDDSSKEIP